MARQPLYVRIDDGLKSWVERTAAANNTSSALFVEAILRDAREQGVQAVELVIKRTAVAAVEDREVER